MSASSAGVPSVFAGGSQAVCDLATRLGQPTQKQSIPESQIQGIQENHRVRNGDTPAGLAIPGSLFSASSSQQVGQYQKLLKRKRGKHGPDSRISPMERNAITEAIRTSTSRKGQHVFLPAIGMEFNSAKEAKDFYNLYSWEIGFGIRRGRNKTNGNNYTTRQDLVCSCEGLNQKEVTCRRTGCKAMIRLHRTSDHGWVISRFEMQHNHPCSATNGPNKPWPSHIDIDPMTKDVVLKLRENNRPIEKVCTGQDNNDTRTFPEAGGLSPTQMSDGMEEVLGTSGLDTVAQKEARPRPRCELEPTLCIQRMATVPVEMEQPLAATEETHPTGSGFSSGEDGDRKDEEDAKEDEENPYEEPENPFPSMSGRRRPMEEEMDPNYIPDDEMEQPPATTSGGMRVLRSQKRLLSKETEMDDVRQSSAPSACLRPDRDGGGLQTAPNIEAGGTLTPVPEIFDRDLCSGRLSSSSSCLPASVQTIVADSLHATLEHHLPLSTATRQELTALSRENKGMKVELTDLSRENKEMKAELEKLRGELNLVRSEAESVKRQNSQLSRDLEKANVKKHQCHETYHRARAALREVKMELDPGELPQPQPQGDDDSDSSFACLLGRVVDQLELVPRVVREQCLKAARFVAQGTAELMLSHYLRLHPQVGLQLFVQAVLEQDLPQSETDEEQVLHDRVLEGARWIAHQCVQVQAPVEDEEDTSAGDGKDTPVISE